MWRFYQLEKHLSSPRHPYHKFGTGTRETLWDAPRREGRDPRAELIEWWREMYCAKRMKLVVMGRESPEVLEQWVRDRFDGVPVRTQEGEERLVYNSDVMEQEQMAVSSLHRMSTCLTPRRTLCLQNPSRMSVGWKSRSPSPIRVISMHPRYVSCPLVWRH